MIAKTAKNNGERAQVIIAFMSGDGGIMRAIELLEKLSVDLNKIQFVAMPFGSGNDMS